MKKIVISIAAFCLLVAAPLAVMAQDEITEVTAADVGASATSVNNATEEDSDTVTETGTLIEIGNTTAEETTIVVRITNTDGTTTDKTLQINSSTSLTTGGSSKADLSDWIAGDLLIYTAKEGSNSGELIALRIRNLSFKKLMIGKNGFVKAIRADENEMDVEWAGQIFTLNTTNAKMVAGAKNPAALSDFQVGDRVRARVKDDGDKNPQTWDASIIVVLRRGETLFMRVTRWVVPAEITAVPSDTSTYPYTLTAKVLESPFFQAGDVNNLIGEPGSTIYIDVTEDTKLLRRFLGKAIIGEFMEGDSIKIIGRRDETTGHITAHVIKNNSIQRLGVAMHLGKVVALDSDGDALSFSFTVAPYFFPNSAVWTIKASDKTKVYKNGEEVSFSTIAVGDVVRLRGTANRKNKTIMSVTGIAIVTDKLAQ